MRRIMFFIALFASATSVQAQEFRWKDLFQQTMLAVIDSQIPSERKAILARDLGALEYEIYYRTKAEDESDLVADDHLSDAVKHAHCIYVHLKIREVGRVAAFDAILQRLDGLQAKRNERIRTTEAEAQIRNGALEAQQSCA